MRILWKRKKYFYTFASSETIDSALKNETEQKERLFLYSSF